MNECLRQQKTVDIKLPVPIIHAKTMPSFSTLCKIHFFVKLLLHCIYFATMMAGYSILGLYPVDVMHSFTFIRT